MNEINTLQIAENTATVKDKIAEAARKAGRKPEGISLVGVSKTYPAAAARAAVDAGISDLGESRVQEGAAKIDELGRLARWHLIGHLQSNKAALAVEYFDLIQSVDSLPLAQKISAQTVRLEKTVDCLIEVNSSGEASKFGFAPDEILVRAEQISALPGIRLCGLMTIGPWTANEGCIKKAFELTRELYFEMQASLGREITTLSMGMSSDFETAIACGSTMVRVGTAIFGVRQKRK